jgi:hypothetical protein
MTNPIEKPISQCTTRDQALELIKEEYIEFFSNLNPSHSKPEVEEQAMKMIEFTIGLYQNSNYSLKHMLMDPNLNPKDPADPNIRVMIIKQITHIINDLVVPNLELIYSSSLPDDESTLAKKTSTEPSTVQTTTTTPKEPEVVDIVTQRRRKYAELLKPVREKMGKVEDAADVICDTMREYKSNGFDKAKTIQEKVGFYPDDIQNQFKPMYQKLLDDLDEWIYLYTPPPPPPKPQFDEKAFHDLLQDDKKSDEITVSETNRAKQHYTRMVQYMMITFKGDKDMAQELVNWTMQLYEEEDRSKYPVMKRIGEMMTKYEIPAEHHKKLETNIGYLIEMIDRYLNITRSTKKDVNHDQYKDDGYISDDEPIESLPKFDNTEFWPDYLKSVLTCYPNPQTRETIGKMINGGQSGETISPTHPEFRDETSIFMRRNMKAMRNNMATTNGYGRQYYEPPDSPRTRYIKNFQVTLERLQVNAGVTTYDPLNKVISVNRKLAELNKDFLPVVLSLSDLATNMIKLHDMMFKMLEEIEPIMPSNFKYVMAHNIYSNKMEFEEVIKGIYMVEKWIHKIEFNKATEPAAKDMPLIRYAYQLISIYQRLSSGLIIRKNQKSKQYVYVMQPYNYCYGCKIFKMEPELTFKDGFYSPVICKDCKTEIYHLNKELHFKWDDKEKLPYLVRTMGNPNLVTDGPKADNFMNGDVVSIEAFMTAIANKLDDDNKYVIPQNLKFIDLNIPLMVPEKYMVQPATTPTTSSSTTATTSSTTTPATYPPIPVDNSNGATVEDYFNHLFF